MVDIPDRLELDKEEILTALDELSAAVRGMQRHYSTSSLEDDFHDVLAAIYNIEDKVRLLKW